ncbi:MAG: DtxR family transcriptional regulator [Ignavibacteriaceae bacterium]|nr:DtxR family transcriptional regulator [Ignavibacteriaceae bacterium]
MEILLVIALFVVILALPGRGLFRRMKRAATRNRKELFEDALKHLYDCEYKKRSCNVMSIAGNLNISNSDASTIVEKLEDMGLLTLSSGELILTSEGRSYALKVIRIHRLLEKYFADEEGLEETYWHSEAENLEHTITQAEADELAVRLNNPVFDPHGDPIPTADGDIPAISGKPLTSLSVGEYGQITHIEDEPEAVYKQLVAMGLYPGKHIRMIQSDSKRLTFEAGGEECVLAPILADNITVSELMPTEKQLSEFKTLDKLQPGEAAYIVGLSRACRGQQRRRLMDLGLIPGTNVRYAMASPGGEPVAYEIMGTKIALRKQQARQIFIQHN